jgi:hypothetical protein
VLFSTITFGHNAAKCLTCMEPGERIEIAVQRTALADCNPAVLVPTQSTCQRWIPFRGSWIGWIANEAKRTFVRACVARQLPK